MTVEKTAVYIDREGANVYTVFVSANGVPVADLECTATCESVMHGGYCLAMDVQVRVLDKYVESNRLSNLDAMYYPDNISRPCIMKEICEDAHEYEMGTVMITNDMASFYIRRSDRETCRLVFLSKTSVQKPVAAETSNAARVGTPHNTC